jgi:glycosyltransferase involved in cell wall biosynthesis
MKEQIQQADGSMQTQASTPGEQPFASAARSITPLVITYNEGPNIGRVLAQLTWAPRVVVLDSGSTDETLSICARHPNVEVLSRPFDSFASQCNYGLSAIKTEWCLSIDADYVVPSQTAQEMCAQVAEGSADGYYARLVYCIHGNPLRRAILPPRIVLFRTALGHYEQDGHAHRLVLNGRVGQLQHPVLHDDRKSLRRWLMSQDTYAGQEVEKLLNAGWKELSWPDRIRRLGVIAPWLVPAYYLFVRGGIRDGWAGIDYAAQRAIAECVLSVRLIEQARIQAKDVAP